MKYTLISPQKLKAVLSADELADFSLSPDDQKSDEAKASLVKILRYGKEETGFRPNKNKLYIELYPHENGGAVIYFTCLTILSATNNNHLPTPVIAAFRDTDIMIDCLLKVSAHYSSRILKSSLYKLGREYRCIIYPLDYIGRLSISFFSEYACVKGEGDVLAAFVMEHGKEIIADNAIEVIAKHFKA